MRLSYGGFPATVVHFGPRGHDRVTGCPLPPTRRASKTRGRTLSLALRRDRQRALSLLALTISCTRVPPGPGPADPAPPDRNAAVGTAALAANLPGTGPERRAGLGQDAAPSTVSPQDLARLGRSTFALGLGLERIIAGEHDGAARNVVISPYSLFEALSLLYAGAREETAREIADVLHYGLTGPELYAGLSALHFALAELESTALTSSPAPVDLLIANSVWARAGLDIEPTYQALAAERYGSVLDSVDFARSPGQARERINGWVKRRTRGLVPELFPSGSLASSTALVVVNTAYLRSSWEEPFPRGGTRPASFEKGDGRRTDVPTMHAAVNAGYLQTAEYQAAELRYAGDRLSLFLVLPARGKFAEVERSFKPEKLAELAESLPRERRRIRVSLPKFKLAVPLSLNASLAKLGMKRAFGPGADFSGMAKGPPGALFVGQIRHQTHFAVDEEQTEAAAATGIVMSYGGAIEEVVLQVDHPFFFGIRDKKTGVLLFWGRVLDPSSTG